MLLSKKLLDDAALLPRRPGVYTFFDKDGLPLYIGKARSMHKRVRDHLHNDVLHSRLSLMITKAVRIEGIVTGTEVEALLLEDNMIKSQRPRYNILLRDDKTYPFIKLSLTRRFPALSLTRRVTRDGSEYYGPFVNSAAVRNTLELLNRAFRLVRCKNPEKKSRTCMYYQVDGCMGPCVHREHEEEYARSVQQVRMILQRRKVGSIIGKLEKQMYAMSLARRFEEAARMRDLVTSLGQIMVRPVVSGGTSSADYFAAAFHGRSACVVIMIERGGKVTNRYRFMLQSGTDFDRAQAIGSVLKQYYENAVIPEKVVVAQMPEEAELIKKWLSKETSGKVCLAVPGDKRSMRIVDLAAENAASLLASAQRRPLQPGSLGKMTGLENGIRCVDAVDISTHAQKHSVGAVIRWQNGAFSKKDYRRFIIRQATPGDDFGAIHEVVTRHLAAIKKKKSMLPDLFLIDGGRGQLTSASNAVNQAGLDLPLAALAKKEEILFTADHPEGIRFEDTSVEKRFITAVRDEVHRYVISFHRKRSLNAALSSVLDDIPGLGKVRKKRVMTRYVDLREIKGLAADELARSCGLPLTVARGVLQAINAL